MNREEYSGIWVFAEQRDGAIESTVLELLGKAAELKRGGDNVVTAVLMGYGTAPLARTLFEYGAEQVILCESEALREYSARPYEKALTQLVNKYKPSILLYGATPQGRDLAPRVMASLGIGLTADAIDLGYDEDGVFFQTTPAYGGRFFARITIPEARPQMATVHPRMFSPMERKPHAEGLLIREPMEMEPDTDYEVLSFGQAESSGPALDKASVIVAGGRGLKSQEELSALEELASLLGGQLGCSRPLVDKGWLPHSRQIGQSGVTAAPELILNVAVSGSVQYQLGMQKSKCIVAINQDRDAAIFDISKYGIVADYRELIPALVEELRSRMN